MVLDFPGPAKRQGRNRVESVVLVTGGAIGIGAATAKAVAQQGAHVVTDTVDGGLLVGRY
jgi:hypothetical protein